MAAVNGYTKLHVSLFFFLAATVLCLAAPIVPAQAAVGVTATYLHSISDFNGVVPYTWATMHLDQATGELYVIDGMNIRIYDSNGMETYSFSAEEHGHVSDLAVDAQGNILLLTDTPADGDYAIIRCNFRGDFMARINIQGLSAAAPAFRPDTLSYHQGHLYLVDKGAMQVIIADEEGRCADRIDLATLIGIGNDDREKSGADIVGFSMDRDGNMLFTVPVLFRAFVVAPDGKVKGFGQPGSRPGKFNIAAGIAADAGGYCYVTDTLRSVVMVFDQHLEFIAEFGYRGSGKENLVGARDVTVSSDGRLYITQLAKRGISVFRITYN